MIPITTPYTPYWEAYYRCWSPTNLFSLHKTHTPETRILIVASAGPIASPKRTDQTACGNATRPVSQMAPVSDPSTPLAGGLRSAVGRVPHASDSTPLGIADTGGNRTTTLWGPWQRSVCQCGERVRGLVVKTMNTSRPVRTKMSNPGTSSQTRLELDGVYMGGFWY